MWGIEDGGKERGFEGLQKRGQDQSEGDQEGETGQEEDNPVFFFNLFVSVLRTITRPSLLLVPCEFELNTGQ